LSPGTSLTRLDAALRGWEAQPLAPSITSVPPDIATTATEIRAAGISIFDDRLTFPQMILRWPAVLANIASMQSFCDDAGAWLAPHVKTTMAPHVIAEQLRAGAWAVTVATSRQALSCRAFGIERILLANEVTHPGEIGRLATALCEDPAFELVVLVDDPANVAAWADAVVAAGLDRPVGMLVELGWPDGRTGARDQPSLERVVRAVRAAHPRLELLGIEGYEGIAPGNSAAAREQAADGYLDSLAEAARRILPDVSVEQPLVSAGGSIYFDRVVDRLGTSALPEYQLVLRSGGYVTHDDGLYLRSSPLSATSDRLPGYARLQSALELWGVVVSRPERDLAIVGFGHRDAPARLDLPVVRWHARLGEPARPVEPGLWIRRMDDQHAYLDLDGGFNPSVGDLVGCGISHPCEAFERWRVMLAVDDDRRVVGLIPTFF
jgi:D-serine deaminase-like pyridoxal phosphate-dependent protein